MDKEIIMLVMNEENLSEIIPALKRGKIIVFPTETSYGLGCDATNQKSVDKIFKMKGRKGDKPMLVIVPNIEMAKSYLAWNSLLDRIAYKYWPGPLTVVGDYVGSVLVRHGLSRVPKAYFLANGVVSAHGTLAIRVTDNFIPKFLSEKLGHPLVATSANLAGQGDLYDAKEAQKKFETGEVRPDIIIDKGVLPKVKPTTIVSVVGGKLQVLRQGEITVDVSET